MSDISGKNELLWGSIARAMYLGVVSYTITIAIAFLRDFSRNCNITASARNYASILRAYANLCSHYHDADIFLFVEILRLVSNLVICCLYVVGTYNFTVPLYTVIFYRVCAGFFVLDTISFLLVSESALSVVISTPVIIDAVTLPSLIISESESDFLNFAYLRAVSAFCAYARFERRAFVQASNKHRLLVKLCFQTLTLFYTLSATIQLLEIPGDLLSPQFRQKWSDYDDWNFMNSAYFIIVTLSTVGYGDFSPKTIQGRVYALFIIIIGIIVFSSVVADLVDQANRERGSGYFIKNSRTRHVIVTGNPNITELVHFITEFYSDSRRSNVGAKVVVLVESPSWTDSEWFQYIARNQFLQARLQFLSGSATNPSDLARARIQTSDAVFVLTSPSNCNNPYLSDTKTVMIILAIRNVRNDIPIYAQTLLEDSTLQTDVALSTIANASAAFFSSRDSNIEGHARYPGLYRSVVDYEVKNLPKKNFQRLSRRYIEFVLRRNLSQRQELIDFNLDAEGALSEALHVSQHVCLQEIQVALISGNIRTNGVGTLLSNMYLDVPLSKQTREDPGWLFEYQMGANANLVYSIVPDQLGGVRIKDIAGDLYFGGMLIMATTNPITMEPRPVTDTSEYLRGGDLVMILSYLPPEYITSAFCLVGIRFVRSELRFPLSKELDEPVTILRHARSNSSGAMKLSCEPQGPLRKFSVIPRALRLIARRTSADDLDALARSIFGGNDRLPSINRDLKLKLDDDGIPDHLHGHVVLALEGEAPLQSLPMFLKNLWRMDDRASTRSARRAKVVVVHPSFPDGFRKKFEFFEGTSLFFVEGSPASRATWRKANLKKASAVATMADITQDPMSSDARTIFMLLTLDVATTNDHDLFIVSELVDEKSLEYLREPIHPRRRGARLGESGERSGVHVGEPLSLTLVRQERAERLREYEDSPNFALKKQQVHEEDHVEPLQSESVMTVVESIVKAQESTLIDGDDEENSGKRRVRAIKFVAGTNTGEHDESRLDGHNGIPVARLTSKSRPTAIKNLMRAASMKAPSLAVAPDAKGLNFGNDMTGLPDAFQIGTDPSNRPGAARARRGTLFSRSRYASGELLVQSSAITLLSREYLEPGFVSLFTTVLGTNSTNPGMKIRLVRIPLSMFDASTGNTCPRGRPLIRYMDVFLALVSLGVTPLGIYRSGSAPILIPLKKRKNRGEAIVNELDPLLEQVARQSRIDEISLESRVSLGASNIFKRVLKRVQTVNPAKQRENLGREEIHGHMKNLFEDDEEDDDDDDGFKPDDQDIVAITTEPTSGRLPSFKRMTARAYESEKEETTNTEGQQQGMFRRWGTLSLFRNSKDVDAEEDLSDSHPVALERTVVIPGSGKYVERQTAGNLLPYVYTYPDPNTWCAETDGIYILCESDRDLPRKWTEHNGPDDSLRE